MNPIESAAERTIKKYHRDIFAMRYNLTEIHKLNFHYEFSIIKEKEKVKIQVYFGKKGVKTVLQGDQSSSLYKKLYNKFNSDLFELVPQNAGLDSKRPVSPLASQGGLDEPSCYIGTDESGKGDYFGPLVIAGVIADESNLQFLKSIGVKDSKELSDSAIKKISNEIKSNHEIKFNVISIYPKKYNELYGRVGNVNRILGWGHAKVIENLLEKQKVEEAISDKFGDEKYIFTSLQERGKNISLHQVTKAERYTAVAAASILARERFNSWFKQEKEKLGFELPKGSSENSELAAEKIMSKLGDHSLNDFVKYHFKNTLRLKTNR
ncbi:MAG TPA: ribonuclease HIII [Ignavibacteriaceae bacterium]